MDLHELRFKSVIGFLLNFQAAIDDGIQSLRISQASEQLNTNETIPATAFQKRGSFV